MSIIKITHELPPVEMVMTGAKEGLRVAGDHRKECCRVPENLEYWQQATTETNLPKGCYALICKVCGCRHFTMDAAPGHMGLRGK